MFPKFLALIEYILSTNQHHFNEKAHVHAIKNKPLLSQWLSIKLF